jgi:hypothetical protein
MKASSRIQERLNAASLVAYESGPATLDYSGHLVVAMHEAKNRTRVVAYFRTTRHRFRDSFVRLEYERTAQFRFAGRPAVHIASEAKRASSQRCDGARSEAILTSLTVYEKPTGSVGCAT